MTSLSFVIIIFVLGIQNLEKKIKRWNREKRGEIHGSVLKKTTALQTKLATIIM